MSYPSIPCIDDLSYSYTKCIAAYITRLVGCRLDLAQQLYFMDFPNCLTVSEILSYQDKLVSVNSLQWNILSKKSCCHSKCKIREFIFLDKSREEMTWRHNWSSSFFLVAEKTLIQREEELLAFDFEDMINGIGGALGLFLGWSVLYFASEVYDATVLVIARWKMLTKAYDCTITEDE
jgi:hypothetical protein